MGSPSAPHSASAVHSVQQSGLSVPSQDHGLLILLTSGDRLSWCRSLLTLSRGTACCCHVTWLSTSKADDGCFGSSFWVHTFCRRLGILEGCSGLGLALLATNALAFPPLWTRWCLSHSRGHISSSRVCQGNRRQVATAQLQVRDPGILVCRIHSIIGLYIIVFMGITDWAECGDCGEPSSPSYW